MWICAMSAALFVGIASTLVYIDHFSPKALPQRPVEGDIWYVHGLGRVQVREVHEKKICVVIDAPDAAYIPFWLELQTFLDKASPEQRVLRPEGHLHRVERMRERM